ncbi:glycosyltransferase family 4 protein [Bradyrhizobium sp. CIAT3101]|uniref:glycosyltransferase family 4 protein n=1 Tax=Bradyrhizobium sp. CIAT3101 TaxID=439387 RepID=UPI0024B1F704|nr:glycosyltransferase family 4 protein [Bradyrhizobium sp. CIAT3101]WFU79113.1 glycosyltransferase family 4 protein [Bradyrhizobium sp. CIAT3101]
MKLAGLAIFIACFSGLIVGGLFLSDLTGVIALLEIDFADQPSFVRADGVFLGQLASVGLPAMRLTCGARWEHRRAVRVLHYMGTNFGMTGVETFILQLVAAQKRRGFTPSIVMELSNRLEVRRIAGEHGVVVHDLPKREVVSRRVPRKVATAMLRIRRVQALYALLKDNDVLHIQAVGLSGLDGFVAAALARKPVVVTHHGTLSWFAPQRDLLAEVTFWMERRIASRIVMPYEAALAEMTAEGVPADQSKVIPFCVDEELFSGASMPSAEDEFTLVLVARMVAGKGHGECLRALAKLSPRYPKIRAVFIGDGPTRDEIEQEIDRLGLRKIVSCKGKVDHREVPRLLRDAKVIVLPTYEPGEMYPLCLLEGMALGLPAIGTRWSGVPDIIDDEVTGIIVEPKDEDGLAWAIERFVADPEFLARAREKSLARIRSRFTATIVADSYAELYRDAIAERSHQLSSHEIRIRPPRKLS